LMPPTRICMRLRWKQLAPPLQRKRPSRPWKRSIWKLRGSKSRRSWRLPTRKPWCNESTKCELGLW
jgi:hypothetical protein